jgi:hypothetical protein
VALEGTAFVLVAFDDSPLFDGATRFVHRVLASYSGRRFAKAPSAPVYVLLFSTFDAFDRWSREHYGVPGADNLGTYRRDTREIAVDLSAGERAFPTMAHEMVHPIVEEDFPHAPTWLDECVATVFESPRWVGDDLRGAKWSRRYALITRTLASPTEAPSVRFDGFFGMSDPGFRGIDPAVGADATLRDPKLLAAAKARGLLHYSIARYACLWLDDQDPPELTPFYEAWRDGFASDPTGRAAFERVVGAPPEAVQARWAEWVKKPGESPP